MTIFVSSTFRVFNWHQMATYWLILGTEEVINYEMMDLICVLIPWHPSGETQS